MAIKNTVVSKATKLPINWNILKSYLGDNFSENNAIIEKLVKSATANVEKYCCSSLVKQTRQQINTLSDVSDVVYLKYSPIIQVLDVTGVYLGGSQEIIDSSLYYLIDDVLYFNASLPYQSLIITYECGYADVRDIPEDLQLAVMRVTANMYLQREDVSNEQIHTYEGTKQILDEYKKIPLV